MSHEQSYGLAFKCDSGGILNIAPVAIGIDNANLCALVNAIEAIEDEHRKSSAYTSGPYVSDFFSTAHKMSLGGKECFVVNETLLAGTEWAQIFYVKERDCYTMRYRDVVWDTPAKIAVAVAANVRAHLESLSLISSHGHLRR